MRAVLHITRKMFIRRFYAQNTGLFILLITVMAGIVETITGDDQMILTYHYRLIMGMLGNPLAFAIVLFLWTLFALKCLQFFFNSLSAREAAFLQLLNQLPPRQIVSLVLFVQVIFYLPVLAYSIIIVIVALANQLYVAACLIVFFQLAVCMGGAAAFRWKLRFSGAHPNLLVFKFLSRLSSKPYFSFLLSDLFATSKFLLLATKFFSCLLLYMFLHSLGQAEYDTRFLMLIYTIGLAGHAVIIHKTRMLEETRLAFYRQLPFYRWQRWMQVVLFYLILAIPETIVVIHFMPMPLHIHDGIILLLYTLSFLMLQHALLTVSLIPLKHFLKIVLCIFMVLYFFILGRTYISMLLVLFILSTTLFIGRYYYFELNDEQV